jgi:hypothetical protein
VPWFLQQRDDEVIEKGRTISEAEHTAEGVCDGLSAAGEP